MTGIRLLLAAMWLVLVGYTAAVIVGQGLGLLPIFFGDIARMAWPGQFNLDFLCLLVLSALWTAWRNDFSVPGLVLALLALLGGSGFLLAYLLWLHVRARGDMREVLLGPRRATNA